MGDRVRAAQAAAAEEAKNNAAYSTNTPLPSFNANMQPQQNFWTYDAQNNPVFQVPGFIQQRTAPPTGSLADYIAGMTARDPNASSPAYDKVHSEFNDKQSVLQKLLGMLVPGSPNAGKPMSPDNTAAMKQNWEHHLARINAIAPGKWPSGYNDQPEPIKQGPTNLFPYVPWGMGRGS
jgi:hypothetical protein